MFVTWEALDERSAHEELQALDRRLFLDKEIDPRGRLFYSAKVANPDVGGPPAVVVDWRENGEPLPLSSGLAYEVRKVMASGPLDVKQIIARNREMVAKRDDERQEAREDIARDFERHAGIGNFAIVPRSRGLQLARQRARRSQ